MNIGMRHILPMYPFLTVLMAGAAWTLSSENRRWMYVIVILVVFQIVTSLNAYPVYIPYANELWGGPSQTYRLLSDSNSDWGEQLKATKKYLDQRGVKDCWFVYFAEGVVGLHVLRNPVQGVADARRDVGQREVLSAGGGRWASADQRRRPVGL